MNLNEPVWREDIQKEAEYLGEGARSVSSFFHRAQAQGAPQELLNELSMVWSDLNNAKTRLDTLIQYFYPEPRHIG